MNKFEVYVFHYLSVYQQSKYSGETWESHLERK